MAAWGRGPDILEYYSSLRDAGLALGHVLARELLSLLEMEDRLSFRPIFRVSKESRGAAR